MRFIAVLISILVLSCSNVDRSPLERAFMSAHPAMLNVLYDPSAFEIQILFTQIDTDDEGNKIFIDHSFRLEDSTYFYPASTVKLPVALLAAEFIDKQPGITLETPYRLEDDSSEHTVQDDLINLFAISDNMAYNRLYELLGRDYINSHSLLNELGPFRISHRLEVDSAARSQRKKLYFKPQQDTVHPLGGGKDSTVNKLEMKGIKKGRGYIHDEVLVNLPMDFSEKNYLPLRTQHELLKRLIFPEMFPATEKFNISQSTRANLLEYMCSLPREAGFNEDKYHDSHVKFFLYGDSEDRIPDQMNICNKVGFAYGTVTETAFVEDTENNIRFLLSATILVNNNKVFNDDQYEYETIGIPFMAQLGRELYLYERARKY